MAEAGEVTAGDLDDPATVVYIAVMISFQGADGMLDTIAKTQQVGTYYGGGPVPADVIRMAALSLTEQVLLERPGGIDG